MTERKSASIAIALAAAAFVWNSFLIFYYFYPIQLVKYPTAAEMFLKHSLSAERVVDISFLYFYLNVVLKLLHLPSASLYWINIVFLSLSAALLFHLLLQFFRMFVAILGTVAFLLTRNVLVYGQTFEPEILLLFFMLCFVLFAIQKTPRTCAFAGLMLGLGILVRPTFLPIVLIMPVYFALHIHDRKRWLACTGAFMGLALACLALLWIRNIAILGYFSPYVMNPGTQFFEGSNPNSWGLGAIFPPVMNQVAEQYPQEPDYHHEVYRRFARRIADKPLSIPESNAYWAQKGTNFLKDYPLRTARMVLTKILHLFHDYQWNDLSTTYWNEKKLKEGYLPVLPFALLSSMALVGMLLKRAEWKRFFPFYALFFFHFAFTLVFYVTARQRVSIIFVFIVFACATLEFILYNRKRFIAAFVVILLFIPLYLQTDLMKEESHLWQSSLDSRRYLEEAYRFRKEGRLIEASRMSALSLAAAPWLIDSRRPANLPFGKEGFSGQALRTIPAETFSARFDRAILLMHAKRFADAETILRELIQGGYRFKRDDQESSEPYFYLASCRIAAGDSNNAIKMLRTAEKNSPGDPWILASLAALTGQKQYQSKLFRYFDEIDAHFFLGKAFLEIGKPDQAISHFSYVTNKLPEYRRAIVYFAVSLGRSGHLPEGITKYREAISNSRDPVLLEEQILAMFEAAAAKETQSLFAQFSYGVVLRQFGHFADALHVQQRLLAKDPRNVQVQSEMKSLEKVIASLQSTAGANPEQ